MRKQSTAKLDDDLCPEYDLSKLKGGVRGKYYPAAMAGTNMILIEPDLAEAFPNTEAVNRSLRLLVDTTESAARISRHRVCWCKACPTRPPETVDGLSPERGLVAGTIS